MKLQLRHGLLFHSVCIRHKGNELEINDILIDTGSASTVISIDALSSIGIQPKPDDIIRTIRGVGGTEAVFSRKMDYIQVDNRKIEGFEIEIAGMDYGFDINGVLGTNFLIPSGAILNLRNLSIDYID